jgi:hypothetical protein
MRLRWAWWVLTITLTSGPRAQNLPMPGQPSNDLTTSRVFDEASLPVTHNSNGSERRDVVWSGKLATGEPVHIHESMQPPGVQPAAAHAEAPCERSSRRREIAASMSTADQSESRRAGRRGSIARPNASWPSSQPFARLFRAAPSRPDVPRRSPAAFRIRRASPRPRSQAVLLQQRSPLPAPPR